MISACALEPPSRIVNFDTFYEFIMTDSGFEFKKKTAAMNERYSPPSQFGHNLVIFIIASRTNRLGPHWPGFLVVMTQDYRD
jgi:hypothetical protein